MAADMMSYLAVQAHNGFARFSMTGAFLIGMAVLMACPAGAQEADTTVIGIEQLDDRERIARLEAENKQFREALIALDERSRNTATTLDELLARIERGEQPLVALEIEQLWTFVRALEADNTALREALDALAGRN
jgi:septal ring factor EnvC (AmiA/AmiB activator)